MLRSLSLVWLSFRLGALDAVQYRVDFFVHLVQSAVGLATALAGVALVFSHTGDLGGWRLYDILALVGVFMLVGGLIGFVIRPSMERLMEGVRLGTLDFVLTKPVDAQLLVSVRRIDVWRLTDVVLGAAVLAYAVAGRQDEVGFAAAAGFGLLLLAGVSIIYSFLLTLSTLAFWLVRLENILVIFGGVYEAGRWPVGIYPPWLRIGLTFIVPVAVAITIPVESLTGRLDGATLAATVVLAVGFLVGSRLFWRLGLRHYTGASA